MHTVRSKQRKVWPGAAGSLLLHLLVLASVPGVDTPARCPVMLVSLVTTHAAEKQVEVVKTEPVTTPEQLQKGTPRLAKPEPKPREPQVRQVAPKPSAPANSAPKAEKPKSNTTPIVTSNPSAENTAVVPPAPPVAAPKLQPGPPALPGGGDASPAAPSIGGTPAGKGGQGGTADTPAPVPAKPSVDVKALMRQYGANVNARVQGNKYFPESARNEELSGTVVRVRVSIDVASNGSLISVSASSDVPELSRAAEDAVRKAAPFGGFPSGVEKSSYNFRTTLEYKLR